MSATVHHRGSALRRLAVTTLLVLAPLVAAAGARDLVVVRPGGPRPSEESSAQVQRLLDEIAARAGWPAGSARASYFNDAAAALAHIERDRPGFLLPTPAFLLAHRAALQLVPVNQLLIAGQSTNRYRVVARNGTVTDLAGLAGGSLVGSALAEPEFVTRVVLAGQLPASATASYQRALSALRALVAGQVTAVILDEMEHQGLAALPFADQLTVVFTSAALPNPGLTALGEVASAADIAAVKRATRELCASGEGAAICATYQISGFVDAPPGLFAPLERLLAP